MKLIKLYILSALLTVMALGCYAEEYLPILENGKSWIVAVCEYNNPEEIYGYKEIKVVGETTINDRVCKELKISEIDRLYDDKWQPVFGPFMAYYSYAYEENGAIYYIDNPRTGNARFLFSMNMESDDLKKYGLSGELIRTKMDIAGENRSCLCIPYPGMGDFSVWMVEGIGPNLNFWDTIFPTMQARLCMTYIVECSRNNSILMTAEDFAALRVPGKNAVEALPADTDGMTDRGASFDLQGRPVANPAPGTILVTSDNRKILTR